MTFEAHGQTTVISSYFQRDCFGFECLALQLSENNVVLLFQQN